MDKFSYKTFICWEWIASCCLLMVIVMWMFYIGVMATIPFPFHERDLPNKTIYRICNNMSNTTGATCGAGSAKPSGALCGVCIA